jgi:hypothetical protein
MTHHVVCCTRRYIESLIEAEVASGVPSERVVVAGFSQGGAVAMLMLRSKHKLAGIVGESVCTHTEAAAATGTAEWGARTPMLVQYGVLACSLAGLTPSLVAMHCWMLAKDGPQQLPPCKGCSTCGRH